MRRHGSNSSTPWLVKAFLWYAPLHYSYVWLMDYNPHDAEVSDVGADILVFLLIKNVIWAALLAVVLVRYERSRQTYVIGGEVPKGHWTWMFVTGVLFLAMALWKDPLEVAIDWVNLVGFSLATVPAAFVLRSREEIPSYLRLLRWIAWVVLGIGLYQRASGFIGPHFGRIISTLGGPELLSLFALFLLGNFLWQLRHARRVWDMIVALIGCAAVVTVQLFSVTLAGQVSMVLYLLVCTVVLGGRTLWLAGVGFTGVMAGAWQSDLFQQTLAKLQKLTGDPGEIGRLAEHRLFWEFLFKKATWVEWLFGADAGVLKFENQFYFLGYNYGFLVLVAFMLLLVNAFAAGWKAWRTVRVQGTESKALADLAFVHLGYFAIVCVASNITPFLSSFPVNVFAWWSLGVALQVRKLAVQEGRLQP
ncbi:MAG TPA: hypothetical protein VFV52_08465 [Bacilli bacterium]|nr:hypothetical protein [Bacilli bacterium]